METYTIQMKPEAEKQLTKYDREKQVRFAKKIRKLKENPDSHGKPLKWPLHGYWELYFERKFRIIYKIDMNTKIVSIEAIKHKDEC
jgi:mRNA-degrading endonuclease RelE of RelBE toxin-antitoxin system